MDFDTYQQKAKKYDFFEETTDISNVGFLEKVLGIAGEAGETADKSKKLLRDKDGVIDKEDIDAVCKELGDILWYMAGVARYLEVPLSEVAQMNLDKLESRYQRNKLHGSGDNR